MDENHGQPARGEFVHSDLDGAVRFALAHPDERVLLDDPDAGPDGVPYALTWLTNVPAALPVRLPRAALLRRRLRHGLRRRLARS